MFDWASFVIGIVVALIGAFASITFFEPLLLALLPSRWRFASFKFGKRLRAKKLKITVFVRTILAIKGEEPLTSATLIRDFQKAIPVSASLDQTLNKFMIEDKKNMIKLTIQIEQRDFPDHATVTGELGSITAKELSDRLLAFHVGYTDILRELRAKVAVFLKESRDFYVEMKVEGEPDLIKFLRDASLSPSNSPLDITVKPKGFSGDVIFSDHTIRTTGDMGEPFIKGLRTLLTIYS